VSSGPLRSQKNDETWGGLLEVTNFDVIQDAELPFKICHPERSEGPVFPMRRYYVYIMASKSRVLFIGVTNDIWRRVWEHKNDATPGFTSKYRIHRLVYFETYKYVGNAIAREKRLKGWLREKKVAPIRSTNPTWEDLSQEWFDGKNVLRLELEARVEEKQVLRCAQDDKT
jgi:putative endonuclease